MRRTDKDFGWYGIPVLRRLAAGVLSGVLSTAMMFVLVSCDEQNGGTEPMKMRGFWISVDQDGSMDCQNEDSDLYFSGDDEQRLDVSINAVASEGLQYVQEHRGVMVTNGSDKTILTVYADSERAPGEFFLFGALYVTETSNEKILSGGERAKIYTGFWMGDATRPADHPLVICPFVLVPRDAEDEHGTPLTCGTDRSEISGISDGLRTYFANTEGDGLADCREITGLKGNLDISRLVK